MSPKAHHWKCSNATGFNGMTSICTFQVAIRAAQGRPLEPPFSTGLHLMPTTIAGCNWDECQHQQSRPDDRTSTGPRPDVRSTKSRVCCDGYVHLGAHSIHTHGKNFYLKSRPDDRTMCEGGPVDFDGFGKVLQYYIECGDKT